jgi:hypothetical protein
MLMAKKNFVGKQALSVGFRPTATAGHYQVTCSLEVRKNEVTGNEQNPKGGAKGQTAKAEGLSGGEAAGEKSFVFRNKRRALSASYEIERERFISGLRGTVLARLLLL